MTVDGLLAGAWNDSDCHPDRSQVEQRAEHVRRLGAESVVAVGDGANDARMLRDAALGIAVIGGEGAPGATIGEADVVVTDLLAALDPLIHPRRLAATLRVLVGGS
jgi:soluble P-type ATPase